MSEPFVLALDQGTSSSRAIVFDQAGTIRGVAQKEFRQIFPQPGWVEHDAEEIWATELEMAREALANAEVDATQISAIGITNQRETIVVWDRATGKPIHHAIVWQDRRTTDYMASLAAAGHLDLIRERTGLLLDPYFSGSKLRWILDNVAGARERAGRGELAAGTIDSWLIWCLTAGKVHVTDVTNASRTLLCNIHTAQWDPDLLALFEIPAGLLPTIVPSSGHVGESETSLFGAAIPITGIAGDQQAALFGQLCTTPGMVKNTYGTGCFLLTNTGDQPVASKHRLLTTIAWQIGDQPIQYALEGSVFIAGAAIQWLRDGLGIIKSAPEVNDLAASVQDTDGVYVVPCMTGLGAPYWDPNARGSILGITRGTTAAHIARATLESLAYSVTDLLDCMADDSGTPITELRVDGGAAASDMLLQYQADLLNITVQRPKLLESTALGAAYLAGLATGVWANTDEMSSNRSVDREFTPSMENDKRQKRIRGWKRAVERSAGWIEKEG
jgi:glycerol kinase